MTKKHMKSKDMQNHKIPTSKDLLKEEFGHELGDVNAAKLYETIEGNKSKGKKEGEKSK